jgi:hypothetical protein
MLEVIMIVFNIADNVRQISEAMEQEAAGADPDSPNSPKT